MTDYATTGDGLIAGLQFLSEMMRTGKPASETLNVFTPIPQMLKNVCYGGDQTPLEQPKIRKAIETAERKLKGRGRLLIRKSGTEPLIRVMVECENEALLCAIIDDVVDAVAEASPS